MRTHNAPQDETSQAEMPLQQAQDTGLAPLASGEMLSLDDDGAAAEAADDVAQMACFPT